jgi:hypothetical protein
MRTIQKLMGHRHIGTTALYCDVADDMLRSAVEYCRSKAHAFGLGSCGLPKAVRSNGPKKHYG